MSLLNITTAIIINHPIEDVFNFIQDLTNHELFSNEFLDNFQFPSEQTAGIGAMLECRIKFLPFPVPTNISITSIIHPIQITESGTQGGKSIKMIWNLHPIDQIHTAVNIVMSCEVNPVLSESAIELVQNQITCAYYRALNRLKLILENKSESSPNKYVCHQATVVKVKSHQV